MPSKERPHFPSVERLAVLELRAARGWSIQQTAQRFHLSPATLTNWMRRLDEKGPEALVHAAVPLNKYPDVVAYTVQRLKVLCPSLGYGKIAQLLCREGLRLGTSTVQRFIRRPEVPRPEPAPDRAKRKPSRTNVIGRHPNHVWHCDLTTVPTSMGFWMPSLPFGFSQRWPFCWWLVVLADQFSARILRLESYQNPPTPEQVRAVVARAVDEAGAAPEYWITDKGPQFRDDGVRGWCELRGVDHRSGSLGQFGSIPFIERLILTVKKECTRRILFPFSHASARKELALFTTWYNRMRPHERLGGATPDEIHHGAEPKFKRAVIAPGDRGRRGIALNVRYLEGRKHLPIVTLERVA